MSVPEGSLVAPGEHDAVGRPSGSEQIQALRLKLSRFQPRLRPSKESIRSPLEAGSHGTRATV
jgi:hypothetical protein